MTRRTGNPRNQKPLRMNRLLGDLNATHVQQQRPEAVHDLVLAPAPKKPVPKPEQLTGLVAGRILADTEVFAEAIATAKDTQMGGTQYSGKLVLLTTGALCPQVGRHAPVHEEDAQEELFDVARSMILLASSEQPSLRESVSLGTPSLAVDSADGLHTVRLMFSHNGERSRTLKRGRAALQRFVADFGYAAPTTASHGFLPIATYDDPVQARETVRMLQPTLPDQPIVATDVRPLAVNPLRP